MKIAVFYENIREAAKAAGLRTEEALAELRGAGLELLYFSMDSWKQDRRELPGMMERLGLGIEGMHVHLDFPADPESDAYREAVDIAAEAGAGNLLIIPGMYSTGRTDRDLESMLSGIRKAVSYGREDELAAFDLFADRIRTVHLKDRTAEKRHEGDTPFACADGKPVYACAPGSGYIRIAEILKRLKQRGYGGNVIVEMYACDPRFALRDAADSVRWLKGQLDG